MPSPRRRQPEVAAPPAGPASRAARWVRSPSRLAAALVGLLLLLNLPGTVSSMLQASQAELAVLVVVAPVVFAFGCFFAYRLWVRPTRTVLAVFLVIWVTPAVASIVGGGLRPGSFVPLVLDMAAAVLAAFALNEPRTLEASGLR